MSTHHLFGIFVFCSFVVFASTSAFAAPITFDFEDQVPSESGGYSTIYLTESGITASVQRLGDRFDINDNSSRFSPDFGDRSLDPFSAARSASPFLINFSGTVSSVDVSMGDFGEDARDTLELVAYSKYDKVGDVIDADSRILTADPDVPDSFTSRRLSVSGDDINSVVAIGGTPEFPNSVYYDQITVNVEDNADSVKSPADGYETFKTDLLSIPDGDGGSLFAITAGGPDTIRTNEPVAQSLKDSFLGTFRYAVEVLERELVAREVTPLFDGATTGLCFTFSAYICDLSEFSGLVLDTSFLGVDNSERIFSLAMDFSAALSLDGPQLNDNSLFRAMSLDSGFDPSALVGNLYGFNQSLFGYDSALGTLEVASARREGNKVVADFRLQGLARNRVSVRRVPEPSSLFLLAAGLIGVIFVARKTSPRANVR